MNSPKSRLGHVYLIGAGPGDPRLLTLRGAELLANCDVVLYDGLSNPDLLRHAPDAEHVCVGKHGQSRIWKQNEIIAEMLEHARQGRKVARLKGGDPAVFARTAEEVEALKAAKIPFEIVPGITAALAAGSYAGIPITHRKLASAVALITGHEEPGKAESALDWDALANFPGTLVVYMGVTTAAIWTSELLNAGKSPDTPVAIIRRCSHDDQRTIHCKLCELADRLSPENKIRPPVIVILGKVTELAETMSWIEHRPLFGQTVLVTRPTEQADSLASLLRDQGASVLRQPAIKIGPIDDWGACDEVIHSLGTYDTIVFCSKNGVDYFLGRLIELERDVRDLGDAKIAVVGSHTAEALSKFGLRADLVPGDYRASSLAQAMASHASGEKVLIVRASRGSDVLAQSLSQAGADVHQVVAYAHEDVTEPDVEIQQLANDGKIDWITIASSATAESLHKMLGPALQQCRIASLSPVTTQTLRDLGIKVDAEANPYTMSALVDAIVSGPNH